MSLPGRYEMVSCGVVSLFDLDRCEVVDGLVAPLVVEDIDLIVESPAGTSSFGFVQFKQLIEQVLGREIDLVDYGGPKPKLDDDIRREAVLL